MKKSKAALYLTGSLAVIAAATAYSAPKPKPLFDQNVTPDAIFGSGNANGSYTVVTTADGVEIGLRAKQRFPAPANVFFSNGDGTYTAPAGSACPGFGFAPFPLCLATPFWSFEWSINTDALGLTGATLDDFIYELGMDADPSKGTDFTVFDPITPNLVAPGWDHSLGNNATPNGGGIEDVANYAANIALFNVAQNSWNYEFFNNVGTSLGNSFDPAVEGDYTIYLRVIDPNHASRDSRGSRGSRGSKGSKGKNGVIAEVEIEILARNP